jgi:hypothetical protein
MVLGHTDNQKSELSRNVCSRSRKYIYHFLEIDAIHIVARYNVQNFVIYIYIYIYIPCSIILFDRQNLYCNV